MTRKTLCVDDAQSIRTMLEKVLTTDSYEVLLAISGEEGVALASALHPLGHWPPRHRNTPVN